MKLENAISALRPGEKWILPGEQILENVIWENPNIIPPTQQEVDQEIERQERQRELQNKVNAATSALNKRLLDLCVSWGYTSLASARAWQNDKNPKYRAESQVICDYSSDCFAISDQIEEGAIPMPSSVEDFLALLPELPQRPIIKDNSNA